MADQNLTVSTRGPRTRHIPMDRAVKQYPITEHEMTTLGTLNVFANVFFSLAGFGFASLIGIWIDYFQEVNTSTKNWNFILLLSVIAILFTLIFSGIGGLCIYWRHNEWSKMISEASDGNH